MLHSSRAFAFTISSVAFLFSKIIPKCSFFFFFFLLYFACSLTLENASSRTGLRFSFPVVLSQSVLIRSHVFFFFLTLTFSNVSAKSTIERCVLFQCSNVRDLDLGLLRFTFDTHWKKFTHQSHRLPLDFFSSPSRMSCLKSPGGVPVSRECNLPFSCCSGSVVAVALPFSTGSGASFLISSPLILKTPTL